MNRTNRPASARKYHRIEWIAQVLDVSPRTVRRWIDCGLLEAVKIGGAVRVSDEELQRLLTMSRIVVEREK